MLIVAYQNGGRWDGCTIEFRDLINLANARPGQIAYASGGTGAATHLASELLQSMAKVEFIHVPYRGAGPATVDLISGQVSFMFGTIQPTLPHSSRANSARSP